MKCSKFGWITDAEGVRKFAALPDQDYISERNKLIPKAEALASEMFDQRKSPGAWTRVFHLSMDDLAKGLLK